ncbi:hypothetical protein SAMN05216287_3596 [Pseudomonas kuykendallii]|uniref:Class I SAM-dependent methyltransferase n=1 Tax=Pseudomonas kuykendallii TaxID=1007099 RepID=A0A1H3DYZ7_9PSED|nr:class I SAM-dependent methyltransferase [Pseudomonas kuykendallii]SDX70894.1 hypothetical protein SAMN05216287_3596 [Pseudomonas kuykendallii]
MPLAAAQRTPRQRLIDVIPSPSNLRLAPITSRLLPRNPKILLAGDNQPRLLRYLDGWPKDRNKACNFLIQFVRADESLADLASDSFDFAVLPAPDAKNLEACIHELTRVARQGLITRR